MLFHYIVCVLLIIILISFFIYKTVKKKSVLRCMLDYINFQLLTVVIALIILDVVFLIKKDVKELINFSILTAFVASFCIKTLCSILVWHFKNKIEDSVKLSTNYKSIVKKYKGSEEKFIDLYDGKKKEKDYIPVITDFTWDDFDVNKIVIEDDKERTYRVTKTNPDTEMIYEYRDQLFMAHDTSNTYNQLNIRVDDWYVNDRKLHLRTSRTTYFASLLTNRVMDYVMNNEFSVREIMQPGPFVPELADSSLSNHLGFNAFVISLDGYIPFIKRNNIVSIGKNTYGTSIGASVKTMYALDSYKGDFNESGLGCAIYKELEDELKIVKKPEDYNKDILPTYEIIAAYRDVVEGNKPQLLAFIRVKGNYEDITKHFIDEIHKKNKDKKKLTKEEKEQEDGSTLVWFSKDEFLKIEIHDDHFIGKSASSKKRETYNIVPSAAASIYLTQKYIKPKDKKNVQASGTADKRKKSKRR